MVGTESIRTVFGIIGNILSFGLFASAVPTFYRIIKNNSVKEVKPEYHLAMTMSCLFWVFYGMPFIHPRSILVLMAYGIGLATQLVYLIIFLLYANDNKQRMYVGGVFLIELVVSSLVIGSVIRLAHTVEARTKLVGVFCYIFGVVAFVLESNRVIEVLKTKSLEGMPFLNVLISTLYGLCWQIYAFIFKFDALLGVINFVGFFGGVCQLIIYGVYYKSTPKSGAAEKLATAMVQVQEYGIGTDKMVAPAELQLQDKKLLGCSSKEMAQLVLR